MTKTLFTGVVPPCITPFTEDGALDENALRELAAFWSEKVQGAFICGTYGSGPLLSTDERKRVAEIFIRAVDGKIPVMVQVGATTTAEAVDLAKHAASSGATAISAIPPFYYTYNSNQMKRYFESLVKAVDVPVFAYNNPKTTGNNITPELMAELADLGVAGMKDSTFDILYFYKALRTVRKPGFEFIMGSEALVVPAFVAGARACVPGLGNALPEPVVELVNLCLAGKWEEAMVQQQKVLRLRDLMHAAGPSLVVVQEILKMRGVNAGHPRPPFTPLTPDARAKLRNELTALGVL